MFIVTLSGTTMPCMIRRRFGGDSMEDRKRDEPDSVRRPIGSRHIFLGSAVIACLLCLGWPGYAAFGDRIYPMVMGLPFSLVWNIGWIIMSFLFLIIFHLADRTGSR